MFEKNQFFVIEMESPLEKDEYVTTLEFSGAYVDDMRGMYKASFEYKNGTESWVSNSTQRQHHSILLSFVQVKPTDSKVDYEALAYPGFCNMKRLLDGMLVYRRVISKLAGIYSYLWMERGTIKMSCQRAQHSVPG